MNTSLKAVISDEKRVIDTAKEISLRLREWTRRVSFTIVPLDDYEVVLG